MKHLYRATRVINDIEIIHSRLTPEQIKDHMQSNMVEMFAAEMGKHFTITETYSQKLGETRFDYSLVMMSEQEYKVMLKELHDLRQTLELVSNMAGRVINGSK